MRMFARLTIVLITLAAVLGPPAPSRAAGGNAAGHDLLVMRSGTGAYGALTALPVGSDQPSRSLPSGLFDRGGRILYAAVLQSTTSSLVQAIDARSGRVLRSTTVQGYYTTMPGSLVPGALLGSGASGAGSRAARLTQPSGAVNITLAPRSLPAVPPVDTADILSALSYNGRWLALRDATPNAPDTAVVVVDTAMMRVVATLHLRGAFGLDAIDDAGRKLYLVEKRNNAGPQAYQVRAYDLRARRLDRGPLTEADDPTGVIRGVAYTRAWSPRGDWLYTLYVQPGKGGAFVHALGVASHKAHCIMLPTAPGDGGGGVLSRDALAVSPDGSTLYAVNPALGRMVVVHDLPGGRIERVVLDRRAGSLQSMQRAAALSRDGGAMFVATERGVWVVDTATRRVRTVYATGERVASIALSADGQRLYALEPGRNRVRVLDVARGGALLDVPLATDGGAGGSAWTIEQVMGA